MASKKKVPPSFDQLLKEWGHYSPFMAKGPDLAAVILAVGYIEQHMGSLLSSYLIKADTADQLLDSVRGPIASLSAKTQLAYCLGLIPKSVLQVVMGLAEVRNIFAHSHTALTFDSSEVKERLEALVIPPSLRFKAADGSPMTIYPGNLSANTAKERFGVAVNFAINCLWHLAPKIARRDRLAEEPGDPEKLARRQKPDAG